MPKIETETITPEQARKYLATSYGNRPIRQNAVLEYAVAIEKNKWSPTASKIVFDEKDKLIDGHHRLEACILANKPFTTQVHWGVPTTDRDVIDTGNKRSIGDLFGMYTTRPNAINYAANINQCVALLTKDQFRRPRINTLDSARKWAEVFQEGLDYCTAEASKHQGAAKSFQGRFRNAYVAGAFAFAYKRNPSKVKEFMKQVMTGENLTASMPSYTIRNMIMNIGAEAGRSTKTREIPVKILSAIYCYIKNEPYGKAQRSKEAWDYFIEAYDTAQTKNILTPYLKLTMEREALMKELMSKTRKANDAVGKSKAAT